MTGFILAALSVGIIQTDSYLFRLRLNLGDEFHYKTTIQVGEMPESATFFRMKVVDAVGSCYVIKTTYSEFQENGKAVDPAIKKLVAWNTVDHLGQSIKAWHGKTGNTTFDMTTASGLIFPKEPVTIGKGWSISTRSGSMDSSYTYTLKKVFEVKGRKVAEFGAQMGDPGTESSNPLKDVRATLQIDLKTGVALAFRMQGVTESGSSRLPIVVTLVKVK
jgi:hypothetical protein